MSQASVILEGLNPTSIWTKVIVTLAVAAALAGFVAWGIHEHRGEIRDADKSGYDRAKAEDAKSLADSEAKAQTGLALGWQLAAQDSEKLAGNSQAITDTLNEADNVIKTSPNDPACGTDLTDPRRLFRRKK